MVQATFDLAELAAIGVSAYLQPRLKEHFSEDTAEELVEAIRENDEELVATLAQKQDKRDELQAILNEAKNEANPSVDTPSTQQW